MKVKIKKTHPNAKIPVYQSRGASGFDFHALEDVILLPGDTKLIKTGLSFEIPEGYELQVRPRSGMSLKTKMRVSNSPGTVDADYRGEVCIIADHITGDGIIHIKKGDRVAQGVICPIIQAQFEVVDILDETSRGSGAFGSTGR